MRYIRQVGRRRHAPTYRMLDDREKPGLFNNELDFCQFAKKVTVVGVSSVGR